MSLTGDFNPSSSPPETRRKPPKAKRPAPFSLRLTEAEKARLLDEAKGAPLGSYIKAKALGTALPVRMRRTGLAVADREALAKMLALLGQSRLASNLNQLAHAANSGSLAMTPETEAELRSALDDIHALRRLLMTALGLQLAEAAP